MPYIQLNGTQYPLRVGAMRVGAGVDAEIRVPGAMDPAAAAVVEVGSDQAASIRRAHVSAVVAVNGVQLGVEPAPLLHGDKIELAGHELFFGDDRQGGSTQYIPNMGALASGGSATGASSTPSTPVGAAPAPVPPRPPARTAATGGLLRSLVDGREYPVAAAGLVIGRDAGCDVVVPSTEVSRRHATIVPVEAGYELRDTSTNGVWVNGTRIAGAATLGRGDVVRIGGEEFRFYADVTAAAEQKVAAPASAPASAPVPVPVPVGAAVAGAAPTAAPAALPIVAPMADFELAVPKPAPAPAKAPATEPITTSTAGAADRAASPPRTALATLEVVNEGLLKGQRFEIHHPLAHVGRGEHNEIVIGEESVSDSHAKFQKREGHWFVVDMGSTNGTYVAGRRVEGERELTAGADVRFGGVKLRFHPLADRAEEAKGTRVIAGAHPDASRRAAAPAAPGAGVAAPMKRAAPAPTAPAAPTKSSSSRLFVLLFVLLAAAAAYLLGFGR